MIYLLIPYTLIFIYFCWRNLKTGIFWLILTLPVYLIRFKIFGLPSTLLELNILILFAVFFIKHVKQIKHVKLFNKKFLYLYIFISLFLFSAIVSVLISPNIVHALGILKAYFLEPILFLIVFISVIKREDFPKVFQFLSLSVFLLSAFAIYQKFTGAFISNPFWSAEVTRRVTSVFSYPNALALYLTPILILLIGWLVGTRHGAFIKSRTRRGVFLQIFYWVTILISILTIYWTRSKGALIALLAGIIFYAIFYKNYRKIFSIILIILLFSFLTFSFLTDFDLSKFLKGNATVEGGDSVSTRLEMWSETWQMLKTQPILGAGLAGYQIAVAPFHTKDYIEIYLYPHNIFLNFWSEIGLLGLIGFILIIIWFYKRQTTDDKQLTTIIKASMFVLLIHGLVDVPYFKNDLAILFWLLIGMMMILVINKKTNKEDMDYKNIIDVVKQRLESAHDMEREHVRKDFFEAEYNFFKEHIKNQKVLVAGSGLGHDSFELAKCNKEVIGIELIDEYVKLANKNKVENGLKNVKFEIGDFTKLKFKDKFFDCVVLNMGTIGDFKNKKKIIKELLRVASKVYFDFYPPTKDGLEKRKRMYEEEKWHNVRIEKEILVSEDGLYSESISKDKIKKIIDEMGLKVKFYDFCDIATMAKIEK